MLHTSIAHAINKQIIVELSAQMTYLSMAAWLEAKSLKGFAKWFKKQADEEHEHAMKFYHFVLERGGSVTLTDIPVAQSVWKTPLDIAEGGLAAEQQNTANINSIFELARKHGDYATEVFLHWFIEEQVEEEALMTELIDRVTLTKNHDPALLILDKELGSRE